MVGAPDPEVVTHDVVAVDLHSMLHFDFLGNESAYAQENVGQYHGIFGVAYTGFLMADLEHGVRGVPCVEQNGGNLHAVDVIDQDTGLGALGRNDRRPSQTHHQRVGKSDVQRLGQFEHARSEEQVFARGQILVELAGAHARTGHEEVVEQVDHRAFAHIGLCVADALAVAAYGGTEHLEAAVVTDEQEGFFAYNGSGGDERHVAAAVPVGVGIACQVGLVAQHVTDEYEIVSTLGEAAAALIQETVAGEPLLLSVGTHRGVKTAVGRESAADPAVLPLVAHRALRIHAAVRRGLRYGPVEHLLMFVAFGADHREVLDRTPEGACAVVVTQGRRRLHVADLHIVGHLAQTGHVRVETYAELAGSSVVARLEEQRVAPFAHLVVECPAGVAAESRAVMKPVDLAVYRLGLVRRSVDPYVRTEQLGSGAEARYGVAVSFQHYVIVIIWIPLGLAVGEARTGGAPYYPVVAYASCGTLYNVLAVSSADEAAEVQRDAVPANFQRRGISRNRGGRCHGCRDHQIKFLHPHGFR